jgi:hypothetical protein
MLDMIFLDEFLVERKDKLENEKRMKNARITLPKRII